MANERAINVSQATQIARSVKGQLTELNGRLSYRTVVTRGANAQETGPLVPFFIKAGDSVTVTNIDGSTFSSEVYFRIYDRNKTYLTQYRIMSAYGESRTFTLEQDAYYIGFITVVIGDDSEYIVTNNSNEYLMYINNKASALENTDMRIDRRLTYVESRYVSKNLKNRFNTSTITEGYYIAVATGEILHNDSFFASDYIYVGDIDTVKVSYTHLFGWYDANKTWLGHPDTMNSGTDDLTFTRPSDAVYLRFSAYKHNLSKAQVGEDIGRDNYVAYGIYTLPDLRISERQIDKTEANIIVDASGAGDYTSFTQAIYDTIDSGIDVLVKPGTYDIVTEYIALFGQSAVDNMADADSSIFNGFQYGVRLRKRRVEFAPGAHLVCDWTGHTVNGTHRFSALGVGYNVEIVGLDLDVTATFYCIHDDYGIETPYTVKYENCRVVGHNLTNANCIGGGCKKYSRHILNNCYFDNNLTGSATVRYHNTNAEGAEPEIYVSNCYFNNWFTPRWYGPQTSKMRVYVNNCHARAIYKMAESSSYDVDNVELYKWNNEETDPRT